MSGALASFAFTEVVITTIVVKQRFKCYWQHSFRNGFVGRLHDGVLWNVKMSG